MRKRKLHAYTDHDGTYRYLVAAPNIKEAARLLNTTAGNIRSFGRRHPDDSEEAAVALSEPGRVWKLDMRVMTPAWYYADGPSPHRQELERRKLPC